MNLEGEKPWMKSSCSCGSGQEGGDVHILALTS